MNIRGDFPTLNRKIDGKGLIYFDNACAILKPKAVIDVINHYYRDLGACGGSRTSYCISNETNELCDKAREKTHKFINAANSREIIWTRNTTESINLIAKSYNFKKGDEVIVTNLDHHSNILPFYELQKKGVRLRVIDAKEDCSFDLEKLKETINSNTKMVSTLHSSNVTGTITPMKEICEIAHDKNVKVMSDESQFIPHHILDVKESDVDFCAFSSHKLGGPTGIGVLYGKEELLNKLNNFMVGGDTIKKVYYKDNKIDVEYIGLPRRFEAGLQHYSGIIGFGALIKYLSEIGMENIEEYEKELTKKAVKELSNLNLRIIGPKERGPLISFVMDKRLSVKDLAIYMDQEVENYKIMIRTGAHCAYPIHYSLGLDPSKGEGSARVSLFAYNTKEEVRIFIEALEKFLKLTK